MKISSLISAITLAAVMCGCSAAETAQSAPDANVQLASRTEQTTATENEVPDDGSVFIDLTKGDSDKYTCADGWCNGSMFNVTWRKDNVRFEDGVMKLFIDKDKQPSDGVPYSGAEYRSNDFFGYGRYEVEMKAIKNDGVVSSFFTYTGPSDENPWDEIDIEILGKDTTKVQFNYFTNGKGEHEYLYDLGFDASEGFHTYSFEWHEDKIVWYVDGKEAHTADKDIPVTEGRIMMNTWCGKGVDGWLKKFDDTKLPVHAEYKSISYKPFE